MTGGVHQGCDPTHLTRFQLLRGTGGTGSMQDTVMSSGSILQPRLKLVRIATHPNKGMIIVLFGMSVIVGILDHATKLRPCAIGSTSNRPRQDRIEISRITGLGQTGACFGCAEVKVVVFGQGDIKDNNGRRTAIETIPGNGIFQNGTFDDFVMIIHFVFHSHSTGRIAWCSQFWWRCLLLEEFLWSCGMLLLHVFVTSCGRC